MRRKHTYCVNTTQIWCCLPSACCRNTDRTVVLLSPTMSVGRVSERIGGSFKMSAIMILMRS